MSKDGKLLNYSTKRRRSTEEWRRRNGRRRGSRSIKVAYLLLLEDLIPLLLGMRNLINKVAQEAKSSGGEYRIYPSRTEDPKKNPLDPGTKIKFMKQAYPDHANASLIMRT